MNYRIVAACCLALFLIASAAPVDVAAQRQASAKGGNQGPPGGGGGGGGNGDVDAPLIIVFRDKPGDPSTRDLLTSDGEGAYIDGGPGIDYAAVNSLGSVKLGFIQPKRKRDTQANARHLMVDLSGDPLSPYRWSEESIESLQEGGSSPGTPGVYSHNAYFFLTVHDGMPGPMTGAAEASFVIFSERTSDLAEWRISYSSRTLTEPPLNLSNRVTVTCWASDPAGCIAWEVHKDFAVDGPVAAVTGGGTREEPDAGVWELPFGMALCLLDAYNESGSGEDEGDWCKQQVMWP